eukprot:GDKI01016178.1.p1 GENE.GDKI01016178.1~~GDKI01016178.1.p1  ORF type:complete len:366 (+),score=63.00 GDKI01016178.1:63-1100(+)
MASNEPLLPRHNAHTNIHKETQWFYRTMLTSFLFSIVFIFTSYIVYSIRGFSKYALNIANDVFLPPPNYTYKHVIATEKIAKGQIYTGIDMDWHGFECTLQFPIYEITTDNPKENLRDNLQHPVCMGGLVWEKTLGEGMYGSVGRVKGHATFGNVTISSPVGKKAALKITSIAAGSDINYVEEMEEEVCVQTYLAGHDIAPHVHGAWMCGGRMYMLMELMYSDIQSLPETDKHAPRTRKAVMGVYERGLDVGMYQHDPHGGNVAIDLEGRVKLIDFGLVHFLSKGVWHNDEIKKDKLKSLVQYSEHVMRNDFNLQGGWGEYVYGSSRHVSYESIVTVPEGVEDKP